MDSGSPHLGSDAGVAAGLADFLPPGAGPAAAPIVCAACNRVTDADALLWPVHGIGLCCGGCVEEMREWDAS